MSKKYLSILYSISLRKLGNYFLDIGYFRSDLEPYQYEMDPKHWIRFKFGSNPDRDIYYAKYYGRREGGG